MTQLKGMTWNHERGVKPLVCASKTFKKETDVEISWDARSLSDFELYPLEELAEKYDFIMIDHPHIGIANEKQLLIPLEEYLPAEFLKKQEQGTVGQSYASYHWKEHQYAVPLDAAAQVSAIREDLLETDIPKKWGDVSALARGLKGKQKMAIPFVPVHAYSSFFSINAQLSNKIFWSDESPLDPEIGAITLEILEEILSLSTQDSFDMDPIQMLDRMGKDNEIVYSPLVYGYSNYSRQGYLDHIVTFRDMPISREKPSGSMIGGVGLAISTKCKDKDAAIEFMKMVADPEYQKGSFYDDGGQPGHIDAWKDKRVNENCNDFFIGTLETLQYGSMRPRFAGYIDFQKEAGMRIRQFVMDKNKNTKEFVGELNMLIEKCRRNKGLS